MPPQTFQLAGSQYPSRGTKSGYRVVNCYNDTLNSRSRSRNWPRPSLSLIAFGAETSSSVGGPDTLTTATLHSRQVGTSPSFRSTTTGQSLRVHKRPTRVTSFRCSVGTAPLRQPPQENCTLLAACHRKPPFFTPSSFHSIALRKLHPISTKDILPWHSTQPSTALSTSTPASPLLRTVHVNFRHV